MRTTNSAHTQLARIYRNGTGEQAGRQCERGYLNPPGGPKKKAEKRSSAARRVAMLVLEGCMGAKRGHYKRGTGYM